MEIWQHLLILLIAGSGFFVGSIIGNFTKKEVEYAEKWLIGFNQIAALLLFFNLFAVYSVHWIAYLVLTILFGAYVYKKSTSKKLKNVKHNKRLYLNYAFYLVYGVIYGLISKSGLILAYSTLVFVNSIAIGSLYRVKKKDLLEYFIPFACYVIAGLVVIVGLEIFGF